MFQQHKDRIKCREKKQTQNSIEVYEIRCNITGDLCCHIIACYFMFLLYVFLSSIFYISLVTVLCLYSVGLQEHHGLI